MIQTSFSSSFYQVYVFIPATSSSELKSSICSSQFSQTTSSYIGSTSFLRQTGILQTLNQAFSLTFMPSNNYFISKSDFVFQSLEVFAHFTLTTIFPSQSYFMQEQTMSNCSWSYLNITSLCPSSRRYFVQYSLTGMGFRARRKPKSLISFNFKSTFFECSSGVCYIWSQFINYTAFYNNSIQTQVGQCCFQQKANQKQFCICIPSSQQLQFKMKQNRYRNFLVKIKEQFSSKLTTHKTTLSVEEASLLLYKYTHEEPLILHDFLVKATGKLKISWDDLLAYFQEEIFAKDQVTKLQISPLSATEIVESHYNGFQKLVHFIKQKETNFIQAIKNVPVQIAGKGVFLVCLDKEIVFYDFKTSQIIANAVFKYSRVKQKLFLREEEKRLRKEVQSQKRAEEYLDKVQILKLQRDKSQKKRYGGLQRLLTNNLKESVRGSQISSEKSNDRKFFRKLHTQNGVPRRRQKTSLLKIKNDDVKKIFDLFCQTSIQNSITIANTFKESRENFKKYIQLDKSLLQKQKRQVNFDYSSLTMHRNFKKELSEMKSTNTKLTRIRKSIDNGQLSYNFSKGQQQLLNQDQRNHFLSKNKKIDPFEKNANVLQIVTFNVYQNYLLVSLFNRQIRLLTIKKTITNFEYTTIFQKSFKEIVTYLEMYQNEKKREFRIVLGLQVNNKTKSKLKNSNSTDANKSTNVIVYQLDQTKNINHKKFEQIFDFSAKFQPIKEFGLILFDQKGHLCGLELNCPYEQAQEKIIFELVLNNPSTNYRICINLVRNHKNLINLYLGCTAGYIYLFDRLCKKIKYHTRVNPLPILDMQLIKQNSEILALYANGNIAILSSSHLQKYFVYQSYHDTFNQSRFLVLDSKTFYLYSSRDLYPFEVVLNQEKTFHYFKPIKIMNNREKLKNKVPAKVFKEKEKVVKVIEGKGGKGEFLAILYENGELSLLDTSLKYIGSYFYFNISNIVDICCNEEYQFIAILTEDNTVQVVNLYTQHVLFNLNFSLKDNQKEKRPRSNTDSLKSSVFQRNKPTKHKSAQTVKLLYFLDTSNSGIFFSVITQSNTVYHYSQKGSMLSNVSLQQSCGEQIAADQLLYYEDQLLFLSGGSLTILRRKSYAKKLILRVCQKKLIKLKKAQQPSSGKLVCIDQSFQIYLVDIYSRLVKLLYSYKCEPTNDAFYFNQSLLLLQYQERMSLVYLDSKKEVELKIDPQIYFYRIAKVQLIRITKSSGKIFKFNSISRDFQEFLV